MTGVIGLRERRERAPAAASAEALRSLAALLRSGAGPRKALIDWHRDAPDELAPTLFRLSRLLMLGAPIEQTVSGIQAALGAEGAALSGALAAHRRLGGDLVRTLDSLARQIERRQTFLEAARAAGAGVVLSGRIVAGLPLLFLLFAPAARAPLLDAVGLVTLAVGVALAMAGLVWIERLVPSADLLEDPAALVGEITAGVLDGGSGLTGALEVVSEHCLVPIRPALDRARRRVRLGESWPDALSMCGDESLRELASTVRRAENLGVPVARSLEAWADSRRTRLGRDFEAAIRRAPVLMVVPLTVCVLPSYLVLALGPFLRSV
jgi:tight adherence protein B